MYERLVWMDFLDERILIYPNSFASRSAAIRASWARLAAFGSSEPNSHKRDNVHFFINLTSKGGFNIILTTGGTRFVVAALRLAGMRSVPLAHA
jgi:hypothetical protein